MDRDRAIETIVVEELKGAAIALLGKGELPDEEKSTLSSLIEVISYYSLYHDYEAFYDKHEADIQTALNIGKIASNSFTVTHINENEDGSANVEVEMGAEMRSKLLEEGFNFLLVKAAVGGTTSDILTWATAGKC